MELFNNLFHFLVYRFSNCCFAIIPTIRIERKKALQRRFVESFFAFFYNKYTKF